MKLATPLFVIALIHWMVGAVVIYLAVTGITWLPPQQKNIVNIVALFGVLTSAFVLQPSLRRKKPLYLLLMPMISIVTIWTTWVIGNWVASNILVSNAADNIAFVGYWLAVAPLAAATALCSAVVLPVVFIARMYGNSRRRVE